MLEKKIINSTCGFNDIYNVNVINFTLNKDLIQGIIKAWKYLENKQNQNVQIIQNPDDLGFLTDDELFNFQVYKLMICIQGDNSFYIECSDDCCSKCYSEIIYEKDILNTLNKRLS